MESSNDISINLNPLQILLENINETNPNDIPHTSNYSEHTADDEPSKSKTKKNENNLKMFICSFYGCDKLFGKESRLIHHERTHTGDRPFRCPHDDCTRSYTRQFHLTRHLNVSHRQSPQDSKETVKCDECNKEFSNIYARKKHKARFHNGDRHMCKDCGQIFRKQQHLKTHSYVHTGEKPYKCDFPGCTGAYTVPSVLKRHSLSHVKERYGCPYEECTLKFDKYTQLRRHLATAHPKVCDVCKKEFNTLGQINLHLRTHHDVREAYFCPFTPCERYYYDEKNLRDHIHQKHNGNFRGFECCICSKWLATKQKLKHHLTTHDSNKPSRTKTTTARKPRKDKGTSKTNYAKLLSGYASDLEMRNEEHSEKTGRKCN